MLSKAKDVILAGDSYPVEALAPYGLLNAIVPADELMTETTRTLGRVARHTRAATAAQTKLFEIWQNSTLTADIDLSVDVFAGVLASTATHEQIERHRKAIGRKRRTGEAGTAGEAGVV